MSRGHTHYCKERAKPTLCWKKFSEDEIFSWNQDTPHEFFSSLAHFREVGKVKFQEQRLISSEFFQLCDGCFGLGFWPRRHVDFGITLEQSLQQVMKLGKSWPVPSHQRIHLDRFLSDTVVATCWLCLAFRQIEMDASYVPVTITTFPVWSGTSSRAHRALDGKNWMIACIESPSDMVVKERSEVCVRCFDISHFMVAALIQSGFRKTLTMFSLTQQSRQVTITGIDR